MTTDTTDRIKQLLTAAADLLQRGYVVLPLGQPDTSEPDDAKGCHLKKWQSKKLTLSQIERQLRRVAKAGREPNIGVRMGPDSGPVGLIDFEYDSAEQLADLGELFNGELPRCPSFKATRGDHYLFAFPAEFRDVAPVGSIHYGLLEIKLGAGGRGSQSAFPPSTNREWIVSLDEMDPPPLPAAVVATLLPILRAKAEAAPLGEWSEHRDRPIATPKSGLLLPLGKAGTGHTRRILAEYAEYGLSHPSSSPSPVRATMKKMEPASILAGTELKQPIGEYATTPRGRVAVPPQKGPAAFPGKGGGGAGKSTRVGVRP